jgi:hypothetical protein
MIWEFDGFGMWLAESSKMAVGNEPKSWVIEIQEDATFAVCNSDKGLMTDTQSQKTFRTLVKAKDFCEKLESKLKDA